MTDLSDIGKAAGTMSHAEFRAAFDPADIVVLRGEVNYDESSAYRNVVLRALANRSAPDRVAIVTDLLDHGWEVGEWDLFHLFHNRRRDVELELPLVERLLDGGADPNILERRGDRPVMLLLSGRTPDTELAPLLDAVLRHDTFDPHARSTNGLTVWRWLHLGSRRLTRARSIDAIRAYCERTGRPVPRLGDTPRESFHL